MAHERNPEFDSTQDKPERVRAHPNPAEDISAHSQPANMAGEEQCGPDGSGEAPETDDEQQIARGAD